MQKIFFSLGLVLSLLILGCSPTTELQVLQPADISLPDDISTIVTIDRAKPAKGFNNVLEGLVTGENIGQDRRGRQQAIAGLINALTRTPRFTVKSSGIERTGSRAGDNFAPLLSWETVDSICRAYDAQALLAIELYDSDNFVSTQRQTRKRKDDEGNEFKEVYYDAAMEIDVRIGWRLYAPAARVLLDEFTVRADQRVTDSGDTEDQAKRNLPDQERITSEVSFLAGERYGMRIAPVWITVQREWFQKGKGVYKENMEIAARYAKAGQWDRATEIWRALTGPDTDAKTAGRAAFNLAVAAERQGMLETALDWARRAYTTFGLNKGRQYATTLQGRIDDRRRLEDQLDRPKP